MPITHERGYLIPAVGPEYERCAQQLKCSILEFHPTAHVTIVTADMLPHSDQGGWTNDWQMFLVSPYRQTIKLEADMIAAGPVDHWWTLFELRDVVISQACRTYRDEPAQSRFYRKCFDANNLPDVYNAITYWRLSTTAKEFFDLVRNIFENWAEFRKLLKFAEDSASTDVVYAMAAQIMGPEQVTMPFAQYPQIVHMKRHHAGTVSEDWTQELVWETDPLRIQTMAQWGAFHYNVKRWRV